MQPFNAQIEIIGVNPYVLLPDEVLAAIFKQAGKDKGNIPIRGTINETIFKQTLVKYCGAWRLYINTIMLKNSPKRIGEMVELSVEFDPEERTIKPHPKFVQALQANEKAATSFDSLRPSLKHEIVRYLASLKTESSVDRNVIKAISFLVGEGRFIGRDRP